jgi:hypothetical protein
MKKGKTRKGKGKNRSKVDRGRKRAGKVGIKKGRKKKGKGDEKLRMKNGRKMKRKGRKK